MGLLVLVCAPTLYHGRLEFSAFRHGGGLGMSPDCTSEIGILFPIALGGRSSL